MHASQSTKGTQDKYSVGVRFKIIDLEKLLMNMYNSMEKLIYHENFISDLFLLVLWNIATWENRKT
jgi:hypothetical protein